MDLVTITCNRDVNQLLLQAKSIEQYLEHQTTHWVFVNEPKSRLFDIDWEAALKKYYTHHILKVVYLNPKYWEHHPDGWVTQQIHKLESVKLVNTDYLLLDSKNFFVAPTTLTQWTHDGSGILISNQLNPEVWNTWSKVNTLYSEKLKVPPLCEYYAPETPFVVRRDVVLAAINQSEFAKWFAENGACNSEFIWYSYFLKMQEHSFTYTRRHHTIWPRHANIADWFTEPDFKLIEISGIHREWLSNSSAQDRTIITDWLDSLGLIDDLTFNIFAQDAGVSVD